VPETPAKATPIAPVVLLPWWLWWLPGTVLGTLAATGALLVAQSSSQAEGTHKAEAVVQLTSAEPEVTRRQMYLLRAHDLIARTLAEPAAAQLPSVRNSANPGADVRARIAVAEVAPDILSVTLTGTDPDELKVILDHLVKRYVDDATGYERRERDQQKKKLEQLGESIRVEIDALDKNIELIARANNTTGGRDNETRLALLHQRFAETDAEYTRTNRELTKMEAEVTVLKRQAGAKAAGDAHEARLGQLATEIEIKKEIREKLKIERDALQKTMLGGVVGGLDIERMRDALKPQRDALYQIGTRLAQLRVKEQLGGRVELRGEVAVAPTKTRADRVRAVGAPVAIAFAAGFVLATGFSLTGLLFRVLRRAA
jgi:hypothetical protein